MVLVIDPMARTPLYVQIADEIAGQIRSGRWVPGQQLPSEKALQQIYGVSRGTARAATADLVERGLAITVPQRGSYVLAE